MQPAPVGPGDQARLNDLQALNLLDTPPEQRFDRLVALVADAFDVPIAYISLVDANRQWFKSCLGIETKQTPRAVSFCGHTILQDDTLIIDDATLDARFADNPLVLGEPFIRFYAGHPLKGRKGHNVATLCIADHEPREMTDAEQRRLADFAQLAQRELQWAETVKLQQDLIDARHQLFEMQERLNSEWAEAAKYVRSMIPKPMDQGPVHTAWQFVSSSQLGGDFFGYHWLTPQLFSFYLLDVCGHGLAAALLSMTVQNTLRRETLPNVDFGDPAAVLAALNDAFPMEEHDNKFFTIWYGVYHIGTRELQYASAGHPAALLFSSEIDQPIKLDAENVMIGIMRDVPYHADTCTVPTGSTLYLFSDGVFEVHPPNGAMLKYAGLTDILASHHRKQEDRVGEILRAVQQYVAPDPLWDDFSLLELKLD